MLIKNAYLGLKFSFSYFSILPINFKNSDDLSQKQVLAFMLFFLPLVGFTLGMLSIALYLLLMPLSWFGALISAIFYMLLYGFLHTEAIVDVADALFASHSGKDAYKIIKEPTVGAMGVLFSTAFILLKVTGIIFLLLHNLLMEMVAIFMISRLSLLLLFNTHHFQSSFATTLKESLTQPYLWLSFLLFSLLGLWLTTNFMSLLFIGLILSLIISYAIKAKLTFFNGDGLGATLESVEILLLIIVALLNT